jgi:two-component system response regulator YesN
MHRILVVDDEPRQRKILSNVIREFRKEYEVLEAKNGEEALALCKERKMDIVFSDIRMPKMDGLSMIERIREVNRHSRIVVVSGYSDFIYAQKALDMRVHRYILKPIESSVIWDIVVQMEEDILSATNSENEKNIMTEQLNLLLPFYRDHLMSKWIKGECTQAELTEVEGVLGFRGSGYIVLTRMTSHARKRDDLLNTAEDVEEIRLNVKTWVSEVLHPHGHILSFFWQYDTDCMVSLLKCSRHDKDGHDNMAKELQMLNDNVLHDYGIALSMGAGTVQEDIFTSVQQTFRTAEASLRCHFYMNNGQIVRYSDIQHLYLDKLKASFPFEDDLKQFVHGHNSLNAGKLETGLKLLLDGHYPDPESLLDHICDLMLRLHHSIQHIVSEETDGHLMQKINNTFLPSSCTSLSQLKRKWNQILIDMANVVQIQKDNKNSIVMERCLQFIHSHYGEELALEDLAEKYYFNSSYFSTLFKRYTGKHFTAYLTDLRLGMAHKKLLESDKKVYEVAQDVGYRDVKYFNKIFKKHYGLTPNECRSFNTGRDMAR